VGAETFDRDLGGDGEADLLDQMRHLAVDAALATDGQLAPLRSDRLGAANRVRLAAARALR
jgi:hypothetical protein